MEKRNTDPEIQKINFQSEKSVSRKFFPHTHILDRIYDIVKIDKGLNRSNTKLLIVNLIQFMEIHFL